MRAKKLLDDDATKRRVHQLCGKPDRKNENFFQLRQFKIDASRIRMRLAARPSLEFDFGLLCSVRHAERRSQFSRMCRYSPESIPASSGPIP